MKTAAKVCVGLLLLTFVVSSRAADKRQYSTRAQQMKQALFVPDPLPPVDAKSYGTKATHADIDERFDNELTEAGVEALGSGFPAPSRAELIVVPDAEWQAHRDEFIYESWLKRAQESH